MDRRKFLRQGALVAAGLAAASVEARGGPNPAGAAAAPGRPPAGGAKEPGPSPVAGRQVGSKLKLSCAAYSFREELSGESPKMTLEAFVDFCARHALEATELTSYYFRETSLEYLHRLRRRAYVNGLDISGTPVGNDFCRPQGPEREKQIAHVKRWIDHVVELGSQTVRVFAGNAPRGSSEEEARGWAIECLKEVSDYAAERGVLLALENHGGITETADQLLALIDGVRSPWLGANLDTGNFRRDTYAEMEKAAPHAVCVQVKTDVKNAGGETEEADFGRIAEILRRAGYRGYVVLEYEGREDATAAVPRHLEKLRRAIGGSDR